MPIKDLDREKLIVPVACKSAACESVVVFNVCRESVDELVDLVEDNPLPD